MSFQMYKVERSYSACHTLKVKINTLDTKIKKSIISLVVNNVFNCPEQTNNSTLISAEN